MSERANIQMIHGDCMDYMATLPDKAFDLAIADPPYGIGDFNMKSGSHKINTRKYKTDCTKWNNKVPNKKYFSKLKKISKKRIIFGAIYYNCFESGAVVWYKNIGHPNLSQCEIASLSFQKKIDFVQINWPSGFYREIAEDETIHPCQKPVALYKWLLSKYAKPGDRILDTHGGSGSICLACWDMGFDLVWIEKDADYYKAAVDRFERHKKQLFLGI